MAREPGRRDDQQVNAMRISVSAVPQSVDDSVLSQQNVALPVNPGSAAPPRVPGGSSPATRPLPGYDVSRVLAGSMGTLGVITDVSLKVLPVAPGEATLAFTLGQHEALEQLHRWGQPLPINASRWEADRLLVRLRGAVAAVEAACERMRREAGGERVDNAAADLEWAACRDRRGPSSSQPPPTSACGASRCHRPLPVLALRWPQLTEWQGAQRWLWAPAAARRPKSRAATAAGEWPRHAVPCRGRRCAGRAALRPRRRGHQTINERLRREFDPAGIFTPGRMG